MNGRLAGAVSTTFIAQLTHCVLPSIPVQEQITLLLASLLLVLIVELLNSAIEAVADAVSLEANPLIGRAKDLGSAAVMLSLLTSLLMWLALLVNRLHPFL